MLPPTLTSWPSAGGQWRRLAAATRSTSQAPDQFRIFAEEVLGWYSRRAVELGVVARVANARSAAVTAHQRWG